MKLLACSLLFLLLPVPHAAAASESALPDWLPPDSKFVIGIHVRSLVESPLVKSLMSQLPAMPPEAASWVSMTSAMGFDPSRDLDEVLIASTGPSKDAPSLILIRGRFNLDKLAAAAGAGAAISSYHGVQLLSGGKQSTGILALLDSSTAMAGDPPVVRAAIDRRGHGGFGAELSARIEAVRGRYDIWGLGDRPDGFVAPNATPQGFDSVDRFQFGISLGHGLEMGAELHSTSPKDAQQMMASMVLLEAMMKAQNPQANAAKFEVRADQGTLHLSLAVPEEEMKKAIDSQAASIKSAMEAGLKQGAAAASAAAMGSPKPTIQPRAQPKPESPRILNPGGGTGSITLPE